MLPCHLYNWKSLKWPTYKFAPFLQAVEQTSCYENQTQYLLIPNFGFCLPEELFKQANHILLWEQRVTSSSYYFKPAPPPLLILFCSSVPKSNPHMALHGCDVLLL